MKVLEGAALPKKLGGVFLIVVLMLSFASSAIAASGQNVQFVNYYIPWRNEYRLDYWGYPSSVAGVHVHFENAIGQVWTKDYGAEGLTGIYYLTCNGTYDYHFKDAADQVVASITGIITDLIINGTCDSYPDGHVVDGLNVTTTPNGDGSYTIDWNTIPGADGYEIWKDGQLIDTVPSPPIVADPGSYVIRAIDPIGNTIAESDVTIRPGTTPSCPVCEKLSELLDCPEWDTYMGELTEAIRNALPTLTEWRSIADQFVSAFDDYFGDVPQPPTITELENRIVPDLPELDTDIPGSDIQPLLPGEYDQPIDFDITTGPAIEVIDESEPIEIYDYDQFIDSDDPGVMVFPGDPRNSSNGIKQPNTIITPYPVPIPSKDIDYETPPADMPVPTYPGEQGTPIPNEIILEIPIPGG